MFTNIKSIALLLICLTAISGCQEDLLPSNDQLPNTAHVQMGDTVDSDLSFTTSENSEELLVNRLQNHDAVVLYFTMWCPVCDSHMSHIRSHFVNQYTHVDFIFVDYVSGSITSSQAAQTASGYRDFDVIADYDDGLQHYFSGTMASTIVIDKNMIILMNEEFKAGSQLEAVLEGL